MCLSAICRLSSEKYPFWSLAHFFSLFVCIFDNELHKLFVCFEDKFPKGLFLYKYFFLF